MEPTASVPMLLLISAPSGAGKTTVGEQLLATTPGLSRAITCTTRAPRGNERDGVDYHFLSAPEFERQLGEGKFLEHATVYGNRYGTRKAEVLDRLRCGQDVLLNIDVQGARAVREQARADAELHRSLVTVFLVTATVEELRRRLARRGQDAPEVVERRLAEAGRELGEAGSFDYLVVSGTIEADRQKLRTIYEAEKMRYHRTALPAGLQGIAGRPPAPGGVGRTPQSP